MFYEKIPVTRTLGKAGDLIKSGELEIKRKSRSLLLKSERLK